MAMIPVGDATFPVLDNKTEIEASTLLHLPYFSIPKKQNNRRQDLVCMLCVYLYTLSVFSFVVSNPLS